MLSPLKKIAKAAINRIGYDVIRINKEDLLSEGFPARLAEANKAGADVNDWLELQWGSSLDSLSEVLFPYLDSSSCVCEIGPGTGRQTRHIIPHIQHGTLHLFDHSTWLQSFLKNYFAAYPNVTVHTCEDLELDMPNGSVDVVFSGGTFIELKLDAIYRLSKEFARIVKQKKYVIFDYLDISTSEGWSHLESRSPKKLCFSYHCGHTIDELFANAGFTPIKRKQVRNNTYVVFMKK